MVPKPEVGLDEEPPLVGLDEPKPLPVVLEPKPELLEPKPELEPKPDGVLEAGPPPKRLALALSCSIRGS